MKRSILLIMMAVAITGVIFIAGSRGLSVASEFEDETKKVNDRKAELVEKRDKLHEQINQLEKDKKDVMKYIKELDAKMQELMAEEAVIEESLESTTIELDKVKKQLESARRKESSQYEIMKKRIKYMYENGSTDYLDIILSAKNIAELLNRAEYINKISKYDETLLKDYQETKEKVEEKEKEVSDKLSELNNLKEELEIQKEAINKMADNKEKELKKYEKAIEDSGDQIQSYTEEIEKQEKILDDLILKEQKRILDEIQRQLELQEEQRKKEEREKQDKQNDDTDETESQGDDAGDDAADTTAQVQTTETYSTGFRWPLNVAGTITSYFGPRVSPTAGASSNHQGIDIAVSTGTPIVASQSGTIVTATYQDAAGNYVMIHHGGGISTVYMHCSKLAVSVGQSVKKGDVIGYVGSTGISTGPHLHFGIMVNGSYKNPLSYVSR